ncbi:MAG: hypothetical protein ABI960_03220 [Candidatus Eisenbacteria bacterium]
MSSRDLRPLRPKRDFLGRWVYVAYYVAMGVILSPVARFHYGSEATLRWVMMSALWPFELAWWFRFLVYRR